MPKKINEQSLAVNPDPELFPSQLSGGSSDVGNPEKPSGTPRSKSAGKHRRRADKEGDGVGINTSDVARSSSSGSRNSAGTLTSLDKLTTIMQESEQRKNAALKRLQSARAGLSFTPGVNVRIRIPNFVEKRRQSVLKRMRCGCWEAFARMLASRTNS